MIAFPPSLRIAALALILTPFIGNADELHSRTAKLTVSPNEPLRISLNGEKASFETREPIAIGLYGKNGSRSRVAGLYESVEPTKTSLKCVGTLQSAAGSTFRFRDTYTPAPLGDFQLSRSVEVLKAAPEDEGFFSQFLLSGGPSLAEQEAFIPGIWYMRNANVPKHALGADATTKNIFIREDRMPLPLVMMRDPKTGATLTLIHLKPNGTAPEEDNTSRRLTDARLQFGSLGFYQSSAATFLFPGTEGSRTYVRDPRPARPDDPPGWAERFHPVRTGVPHAYELLITVSEQPSFASALRDAWRTAYEAFNPPVARTDTRAVYRASMDLLSRMYGKYNGSPGFPFRAHLPKGNFDERTEANFQMGFVGQQLPLGYHMLRYGFAERRDDFIKKGESIVDFWAANSLTPEGLPRTWFDPFPNNDWRKYNTFLRVASDGMNGALQAWNVMQRNKRPKPEWLAFCRKFGDWLIAHQRPDGSWAREYDFNSREVNPNPLNTTHPIRFLVDLAKATGDTKYADSALKAGEFSWKNIHLPFAYVGGTADNPNVLDKEAGFMAIDAFLALHDQTGDPRWLDAAAQAGDFAETWVYAWTVPISGKSVIPSGKPTTGFSIIATGHSGADLFMAGAPYFYTRLWILTGQPHYARIAALLMQNPRQFVDVAGSLDYAIPGLCTEAVSFAPRRGAGVDVWLPWLTYSIVEPLVRISETYDPTTLAAGNLQKLKQQDTTFAKTRGFTNPAPKP